MAEGEGVTVSGTATYTGEETGPVHLLVMSVPTSKGNGKKPDLLYSTQVDGPGDWSVELPKDLGEIDIMFVMDIDGDGPTLGDPRGVMPKVNVASAAIPDLAVELSNEPPPVPQG